MRVGSRRRRSGPIGTTFTGIVFVIAGGVFAVLVGWPQMNVAMESETWSKVEGQVTRTSVERKKNTKGNLSYVPKVHYRYLVDGTPYEGTRINLSGLPRTRSSSKEIISQYKKGDLVPVYYSPGMPEESILEPGLTLMNCSWILIASLVILIGLITALFGIYKAVRWFQTLGN